jgi:hypothetical protein
VRLMQTVRAKKTTKKKASCDQKKAISGGDRIALSSPCGEVDPREASASKRQGHGTVLYGKTNNYEQRDDTDILGRDPAGPLAPLGGAEPLLQHCAQSVEY